MKRLRKGMGRLRHNLLPSINAILQNTLAEAACKLLLPWTACGRLEQTTSPRAPLMVLSKLNPFAR